jgi:RNA recognition motif-containing protein
MAKRLYVGNLAYSVTEADLREVFTEAGNVADVKVVLDRESGRPRGFAFVEMSTDDEAAKAMQTLNGREIQGRAISVSEARERSGGGGGGGGGGGRGGGRGGFGGGGGGGRERSGGRW